MKFFLFLVIKIIGIAFFTLICFFGIIFFFSVEIVAKEDNVMCSLKKWICIVHDERKVDSIYIREDVEPWIKDLSQKIIGKVYEEARLHNPQGDVFPDSVDDALKLYIKEKIQ
ncbi:MAG: hypothetical protein EOM19_02885 [Candidatus Moranbacteria bacterium]|nr:hypothetical protein [Candidatus Moranbacteria bacterium]